MINTLKQIGLSEKEAKIYLAITELGLAPASEIGKKAGLNRVTTYDILEKLTAKGFCNTTIRRNTKYFSGLEPEKLIQEFEKRTAELKASLPKFKELQKGKAENTTNHVYFLEGTQALGLMPKGETLSNEEETCEARIYEKSIAYISKKDEVVIVIENPELVKFQKELLNKQSKSDLKTEMLKPLKLEEDKKQPAIDKKNLSLF